METPSCQSCLYYFFLLPCHLASYYPTTECAAIHEYRSPSQCPTAWPLLHSKLIQLCHLLQLSLTPTFIYKRLHRKGTDWLTNT